MRLRSDSQGLSLIEMLVIIVVIGILVAVAMQSMTATIRDVRQIKTEREMAALARAILGDAARVAGGARSDFGFVGDNGAFPPNIEALRTNPGGWATWDGPYLEPGFVQDTVGFKTDEWGAAYQYSGGLTITSTGSGASIVKRLAGSAADYLNNSYAGLVRDASDSVPAVVYRDSVVAQITVPNGVGAFSHVALSPDSAGLFSFAGLPVGMHPLRIIFVPAADTLFRYVTIAPRQRSDPPDVYRFTSDWFIGGTP